MKSSSGTRKYGRNKDRCKLYAIRKRRKRNKMRRVLKSSGERAAARYARGPAHSVRYERRHGVK